MTRAIFGALMQTPNYRADIDGLRALAVLAVMFFHVGFDAFPGGYVGVDVCALAGDREGGDDGIRIGAGALRALLPRADLLFRGGPGWLRLRCPRERVLLG